MSLQAVVKSLVAAVLFSVVFSSHAMTIPDQKTDHQVNEKRDPPPKLETPDGGTGGGWGEWWCTSGGPNPTC